MNRFLEINFRVPILFDILIEIIKKDKTVDYLFLNNYHIKNETILQVWTDDNIYYTFICVECSEFGAEYKIIFPSLFKIYGKNEK